MVGFEYNPVVGEYSPTANFTLQTEEHEGARPLLTIGTSSDRIFSPKGFQSYYLTAGKGFPKYKVAPYVSLNWSEWERAFTFPFGLNVALAPRWGFMMQNDGRNTHWLLTHMEKKGNISLLLLKGRHFGVSTGIRF